MKFGHHMHSHSLKKTPRQAPDLTLWIAEAAELGHASHELHYKLSAQMVLVLPIRYC